MRRGRRQKGMCLGRTTWVWPRMNTTLCWLAACFTTRISSATIAALWYRAATSLGQVAARHTTMKLSSKNTQASAGATAYRIPHAPDLAEYKAAEMTSCDLDITRYHGGHSGSRKEQGSNARKACPCTSQMQAAKCPCSTLGVSKACLPTFLEFLSTGRDRRVSRTGGRTQLVGNLLQVPVQEGLRHGIARAEAAAAAGDVHECRGRLADGAGRRLGGRYLRDRRADRSELHLRCTAC